MNGVPVEILVTGRCPCGAMLGGRTYVTVNLKGVDNATTIWRDLVENHIRREFGSMVCTRCQQPLPRGFSVQVCERRYDSWRDVLLTPPSAG